MAGFWWLEAGGMLCERSESFTALIPAQTPHCVPKLQPVREAETCLRAAATRCRRDRGDAAGDVAGCALLEAGHISEGTATCS